MPVLQSIHRSGTRSNAQARRLLNSVSIAKSTQHDLDLSTIVDERITQPVMRCRAERTSRQAGIVLNENHVFYLVRSRLQPQRFYVLVRGAGTWQCSSKNETVARLCVTKVERYIATLMSQQLAA